MTYLELGDLLSLVIKNGGPEYKQICKGIAQLASDRDSWRTKCFEIEDRLMQQEADERTARICRALETYQHKHLAVIKGGRDG